MELLDRRVFIAGAASFAAVPLLGAKREGRALSRPLKTPLMLDVKRMAVHDGPGLRTTFFVKGRQVWSPAALNRARSSAAHSQKKSGSPPESVTPPPEAS